MTFEIHRDLDSVEVQEGRSDISLNRTAKTFQVFRFDSY